MPEDQNLYYRDYLQLDTLLHAQHPESCRPGNEPAHDEMLFIITHQAYELWFRQILFELDYILSVFKKETIDDNSGDLNLVRHRLNRVNRIWELLTLQIGVLETMTPLDFLEFRNLLVPASGFQSLQFRLIEARLGLRLDSRYGKDYYKRTNEGGFQAGDFERITRTEKDVNLLTLVGNWLERMPFFDPSLWKDYAQHTPIPGDGLHPFWSDYRALYRDGLNEHEKGRLADFDRLFGEQRANETVPVEGSPAMSRSAMRSALFIMLYRDVPVFQTSCQLLDALVHLDNAMADWRHKHMDMVRRMIGMRTGTGNTTGRGYLEGALASHYIFGDVAGLSTFLIERRKLPRLPVALLRKLGYSE